MSAALCLAPLHWINSTIKGVTGSVFGVLTSGRCRPCKGQCRYFSSIYFGMAMAHWPCSLWPLCLVLGICWHLLCSKRHQRTLWGVTQSILQCRARHSSDWGMWCPVCQGMLALQPPLAASGGWWVGGVKRFKCWLLTGSSSGSRLKHMHFNPLLHELFFRQF